MTTFHKIERVNYFQSFDTPKMAFRGEIFKKNIYIYIIFFAARGILKNILHEMGSEVILDFKGTF